MCAAPRRKRYRLYVDESGDHTYQATSEPGKRYLGLAGVVVESDYYRTRFHPELEKLKQYHFPHSPDEPVILHRKEIVNKGGPFWRLRDTQKEAAFNADLLAFLSAQSYVVIAVVIDKVAHFERYGSSAWHPYHYCLTAMLERYAGILNFHNAEGDVMAESRGATEDRRLAEAYLRLYTGGTYFHGANFFQAAFTTKSVKLKPKQANIAGLQVADLLAHPCKLQVLDDEGLLPEGLPPFARRVTQAIAGKYNQQVYEGRVRGYGKMLLK